MGCYFIKKPDGGTVIVCSRARRTQRCACGTPGTRLCDAPKGPTGKRTCSAPLCDACTTTNGAADLCPAHAPPKVAPASLVVHTARVSYHGPDRFDVTRKSGGPAGQAFAPSWAILKPVLEARPRGEAAAADAWRDYVPAYTAEMRASYKANRRSWDALVALERVVLVCYCVDAAACHRTLLAEILAKLGARCAGEIEALAAKARPTLPGAGL